MKQVFPLSAEPFLSRAVSDSEQAIPKALAMANGLGVMGGITTHRRIQNSYRFIRTWSQTPHATLGDIALSAVVLNTLADLSQHTAGPPFLMEVLSPSYLAVAITPEQIALLIDYTQGEEKPQSFSRIEPETIDDEDLRAAIVAIQGVATCILISTNDKYTEIVNRAQTEDMMRDILYNMNDRIITNILTQQEIVPIEKFGDNTDITMRIFDPARPGIYLKPVTLAKFKTIVEKTPLTILRYTLACLFVPYAPLENAEKHIAPLNAISRSTCAPDIATAAMERGIVFVDDNLYSDMPTLTLYT